MQTSVPSIPRSTISAVSTLRPQAQYLRQDPAGILSVPRPALREVNDDVKSAYTRAASYAVDAIHNSGWIAGGIEQAITDTNGTGLALSAKPDAQALGWSEDFAVDWSIRVEEQYENWASNPYECDAAGRSTIAQMSDNGLGFYYAFGEYLASNELIERPGSDSLLKIKMLSPTSLVQDSNAMIGLQQGVFVDDHTLPLGYRFKKRVNGRNQGTIDVPARDGDGRPNVIHVFDGMPGQVRGITPLAPILKITRQYDQLADATLTAALIQTIFAASLKSTGLSDAAFDGLLTQRDQTKRRNPLDAPDSGVSFESYVNKQVDWYSQFNLDLGSHGRIASLFPGQELTFHNNNHPNENYLAFTRNLLREVARMIGITYESLSLDYDGATYSSVLMGQATIYPVTLRRRDRISIPFLNAVYQAWLDERIFRGRIEFPGGHAAYVRNRNAASRAKWRGPPKPRADELKSARAQTERLENGSSPLSAEAIENGIEIEDLARQIARDRKIFQKHNVPYPEHGGREAQRLNADGLREDEIDE